jgi:hypothetical protein
MLRRSNLRTALRRCCAVRQSWTYRSLLTIVLAACSHASTPPAAPQAAGPSPCTQLADHVVSLIPSASGAPADKVAILRDAFDKRCSVDKWTAGAQQCFLAAGTLDAAGACAKNQLTQAQSTALDDDVGAATQQLATSNNAAGSGGAAVPAAAAAPAAAPASAAAPAAAQTPTPAKRATRGAKTSNDPCEGGQ